MPAEIGAVTVRVAVTRKEWGGTVSGGTSTEATCGAEMTIQGGEPGQLAELRTRLTGYCEQSVEAILAQHRAPAPRPDPVRQPAPDPEEPRRRDRECEPERSNWGGAYRGNGHPPERRPERERDRLRDREDGRRNGHGGGDRNGYGRSRSDDDGITAPRTGGQLMAVIRKLEDESIFDWLKTWGKRQDLPGRVVDWSRDDVRRAWAAIEDRRESLEESEEFQESLN